MNLEKGELLSFDESRACPKCKTEHEHITWRYYEGARNPSFIQSEEHLQKTCDDCGYAWLEKTADAEEAEPC